LPSDRGSIPLGSTIGELYKPHMVVFLTIDGFALLSSI